MSGLARRFSLRMATLIGIAVVVAGAGCRPNQIPDPNNPKNVPSEQVAKLLRQQIQSSADDLNQRVGTGEISDQKRKDLLAKLAGKLLSEGDPAHCAPEDAWIYADLMLTEHHYSEAIPMLKKAIQYATSVNNDDRRVNDSLRLARALAETGKIGPALDLTQSVIDSKPKDPNPVLTSVLLEITPVAQGKGHDEQLAKLLEEAIHEHLRVKVDPTSYPGKMFLAARTFHIKHAWDTIVSLLKGSGHPDQAAAAAAREASMMRELTATDRQSV